MAFEYVRRAYGVPACYGRKVTVGGESGFIVKDMGAYIGIVLDKDKATHIMPYHPTGDGLIYGDIGEPRDLTRSQKRYQEYLDCADCFPSFKHFLDYKTAKSKGLVD